MDLRRRRKASVLACGRLFLSGRTENELSWLSGHETAPYTDPDHVWSAGRRLYCPGSGRGGAVRGDDGDSGDGGGEEAPRDADGKSEESGERADDGMRQHKMRRRRRE